MKKRQHHIWIGLGMAALVGGVVAAIVAYRRRQTAMPLLTATTSKTVVRGTSIPMTEQNVFTDKERTNVVAQMKSLISRYGDYLANAAYATGLTINEIVAFMRVENQSGDPTIRSGAGAVGLMQITPNSATDHIIRINGNKIRATGTLAIHRTLLTDQAKAILRKRLGNRLDTILKQTDFLVKSTVNAPWVVTATDLQDPEFNIMLGTLFLKTLVVEETVNGATRWDRVVVRYNAGYSRLVAVPKAFGTTALFAVISTESKNYIKKLAGRNGTMELVQQV